MRDLHLLGNQTGITDERREHDLVPIFLSGQLLDQTPEL